MEPLWGNVWAQQNTNLQIVVQHHFLKIGQSVEAGRQSSKGMRLETSPYFRTPKSEEVCVKKDLL